MKRILILSCGTNACYHISKILKQNFSKDFYIVGCDINKKWLIPTCNYLDEFYQVPYSTDNNYYTFILDICKKEKINFILPSFDNDQFLFSSDNQDLNNLGIKSFAINSKMDFYRDKKNTNKYLKTIGIPVPKIYSKTEIKENKDYFIKPINGVGSNGISVQKGKEIKNNNNINDKNYIIQELCYEPEYTLECFLYNNKIFSVVRERIASKSGVCTKTRIFQDKELEKIAYKFSEKTELPHIFNMQFMKSKKGEYVCTDLNLRPAGGMSLSYAAGWDEVSSLANIMLNKDEKTILSSIKKKIPEQYIIRHYEDSITKVVKKRIAFDLDGTLLNSKKRHEIVMMDVLKKHCINLDTKGLVDYKSKGKNNLDWLIANNINEKLAKIINKEWISLIEKPEYLKNDRLYPDTISILKQLSTKNDLFLITARSNKTNAIKQIRNLGIEQYFTQILIVNSCDKTYLLKALELKNNNIDYFIGDTESDYNAAMQSNCPFFAVNNGFRNKGFLNQLKIKSYNSIKSILESINVSNFLTLIVLL